MANLAPNTKAPVSADRCFQLVLIKPSHYDDDGYVIRWWRAMIPSNSLAAVYGNCSRLREAAGPWAGRRHRHRSHRRDQHARRRGGTHRPLPASRRFRACRARRSSDQRVSPRPGHCTTVHGGGNSGRHWRLPRLRVPFDAGRPRGRSRRLPGDGYRHVRGRGRRAASTWCYATPHRVVLLPNTTS